VTRGLDRPGLRLLGSLFAEERVGRPGPAREQALASAQADPANAHMHLLDAAYAALVAGEARAADRLLAECEAAAPRDKKTKRRIAAARLWSWTVDRGWWPGDVAAMFLTSALLIGGGDMPTFPKERRGDRETSLVERIAEDAYFLRAARARIEQMRESPEEALAIAHEWQNRGRFEKALERCEGQVPALILRLASADLLLRAGDVEDAGGALDRVREDYERAGASGVVGRACTFLVEGDWYATPGSSPEALGFDLIGPVASPYAARRDLARAAAAYDRAAELLVGVDEPRALGALALRRAALAWLSGDNAAQRELIVEAADAFGSAGDAAALRLTTVHALLADIALGRVAATRRDAGTGFDLEPRGAIADLLRWGQHEGSVGWISGLGSLFHLAAKRWATDGDYERAAVAYELAIPLVPAGGASTPERVVLDLVSLDRDNGFGLRALTRGRSAVAALPRVESATEQPLDWGRNVFCLLDVVVGQIAASGTAAGMKVAVLEWATDRLRQLLALPGVPPPGAAQTEPPPSIRTLWGVADHARDFIAWADAKAAFERGKQAAAVGASATANRWYDDALSKADALTGQAAGEAVSILVARDRFDEAQARLRNLLEDADQYRDLLASSAVEARDYDAALRLFASEPESGRPWYRIARHAEAALGVGRIELALTLIETAVRGFEAQFARLRRDVDRLSASDDVNVADLYLLAARSHLARAEQLDAEVPAAKARAFELSDRARALALAALLADVSDHTDDERLILAWRRTSAEWQAAYDRLYRGYVTAAADDDITALIADLTLAEHALVEVEAELESAQTVRPRRVAGLELPSLADIQEALPHDAVLLEYQLVRRDLIVWAITRTSADATISRHARGEIARLARAVQRACANGRPGPEADELTAILVEPAAPVIDACRRLIVVPYGPLHGLPFQVLPLGGRALGQTHVLSYLPAAALLHGLRIDEPFATRRALVVGDPAFDADAHPALPRLPGAVVEAGAIAGTHGVSALVGPDAAEPAIRRELAHCDLVHLAAHGRLDPVAPSDSSIVLAGRDELTVSDLIGLQIDAELAVLSACDSGRGAASLGGDVVGLARGLIAAGARRSVVSLWPVDDAPACLTMSLFHERLVAGQPVAEALHSAQNDLHAMSGSDIAARYAALGGEADPSARTRRRGVPSADEPPQLPDDPEFVDDLDDSDPVDGLSGELARVWAPFVVIGV
jgi:CHAT domain-containing protein